MKLRLLSLFLFFMVTAGHGQNVAELIQQFSEDKYALYRKYPVQESKAYYTRFNLFYEGYRNVLKNLPYESLTAEAKVDYVLLQNQIEKEAYFHSLDEQKFDEVSSVLKFATPLYAFVEQRATGKTVNSPQTAQDFEDMTKAIAKAKETFAKAPFNSWQKADKAKLVVKSLQSALHESFDFYKGYDPQFTWWTVKPFHKLDSSLTAYASFLKDNYQNTSVKDDGSGIIGKPIGKSALLKSLELEFIPYSPEELIAIAQQQFAWCDAEMLKASQEMGFGNDWKAALEKVKGSYVAPGEQPAMVFGLATEAIRFLETNDLVTIPPLAKETWRMGMMSPAAQKINPFFLGGEEILISYPTNTMEHGEKLMSMRGNNPHFSRATVQHELIPGHHLQQYMQSRYKPYRSAFYTPFWTEGWALYWEMNLWDKGFAKSPEDRIGMLFWRMHRCARIIFSLSYHLEKMTPQQCIDFLVSRVGHEYANAEAEVRRSFTAGYDPLYQVSYMIGGLQLYALRKELVASGKMKEKDFHDRILKENGIPIEFVRAILIGEKLSPGYKSRWKFAQP
ncbi:DUF885 family protein [Chryseolinea lacunae]|uniref:DUF885 family protein n=1 Tax=Chryseolinea lacunae TaxID=2801331 RepID=A0ABS1KK54_9BACT|nr:DUF885 family protein [Chryseolinea lacunae]MBL0739825.1 DUF885 family protein [Chryseolinea lacunae]